MVDVRGRVLFIGMGGTIASSASAGGLATPTRSADRLIDDFDGEEFGRPIPMSLRSLPSSDLSIGDVLAAAAAIRSALDDGARGVVLAQGTDTLEETAFLLHLLVGRHETPVVVTAAMRHNDQTGSDAAVNLEASLRVAASEEARGAGILAVVGDRIHGPVFLHKGHTAQVPAFESPGLGPIGWVTEGRVRIVARTLAPPRVDFTESVGLFPAALPIVPFVFGGDSVVLDAVARAEVSGVVLDGAGGGHVPSSWVPTIAALASEVPVVLASRAFAGEVLHATYGFRGSESELRSLGVHASGALGADKARLLLGLCIAQTSDASAVEIGRRFESLVEELHGGKREQMSVRIDAARAE